MKSKIQVVFNVCFEIKEMYSASHPPTVCPCCPAVLQDSAHTFPGHAWLASEDGQAALQRVLLAYSAHNDRVGYCRSMNNIVSWWARLLIWRTTVGMELRNKRGGRGLMCSQTLDW